MTNEERIIGLEQLEAAIRPHNGQLVRDLPPELQEQLRSVSIIGPVTSSGLERVAPILNRISMAIHVLSRQEKIIPAPKPIEPAIPTPEAPPKASQIDPPSAIIQTTPQPPPLDFGPFDPRRKQ